VPCQENIKEPSWLTIQSLLDYTKGDAVILKGTVKSLTTKQCVVKFGNIANLQEEYQAAEKLKGFPCFIHYYCFFSCMDNFKDVIERNYQSYPRICLSSDKDSKLLGGIVMPYYPLGSINKYRWTRANLPMLYNILCQVCFALANAYDQTGFVHSDLHAGNVLLKHTSKKELSFGQGITLPVLNSLSAIVMDLERPKKDDPVLFIGSMNRILTTSCSADNSDLSLEHTPSKIHAWFKKYPKWTPEAAQALYTIIHAIPLNYVKSERPENPFIVNRI
jgi:hypothetical protein